MKPDDDFYEKLERLGRGLLSDDEAQLLRQRIQEDPALGPEAKEYLELMSVLKSYGKRRNLKKMLEEIHGEMSSEQPVVPPATTSSSLGRYWRLAAAAASVTIAAVVGTLLITQSLGTKQEAYYKELRRNVQQIQQSQKRILDDLAETKERAVPPARYSGTGFLISRNGYLVTSFHVIRESDSVLIENETYGKLKAEIVYGDAQHDISILRITGDDFRLKKPLPYTVSRKEAELGEYVYTLGFPREDVVFGEGSISASTGYGDDPNAYQVSVPVNPGNSGGPLLNSRGDLIGIVSGVQTETSGAAFAIKSTRLLELLQHEAIDSLATPLALPRQNTIARSNRIQQVKKWREFVFMVRVYKGG